MHGRLRSGIYFDFMNGRPIASVRHEYTPDGTVGRNRNAIHDRVNWITQKLEAGDERDIQVTRGQARTEGSGMIVSDFAAPAVR